MGTNLLVGQIRLDGGTQPRVGLTEEVVAAYAEEMRQGSHFPPVTVFYDGQTYWLADGFHRVAAARDIGKDRILADVQQGTQRDAILYSVSANADHGLRRSNEDKRRAVLKLLNDAEWSRWNDSEIARQCRTSRDLVQAVRLSCGNPQDSAPTERIVARGDTTYMMRTSAIGGGASFAPIWRLEQGVATWLTRQTTNHAQQIALLTAIQERTTRGLIVLDDLLAAPELAAPRRKGDVQQAVNNVLEQLRRQGAGSREQGSDCLLAPDSCLLTPGSCPLPPAPQLATFAQVQAGVHDWLAEQYPNDGRAVLQAIVESTPAGIEHQRAIFRSAHLPDTFRPNDVPAACANLLVAMVEVKAEVESKHALTSTSALTFPATIGRTTIVHADSRQLTAHVAPGSAHLVITSPPYNVGIAYGVYDDSLTDAEYLDMLRNVFAECRDALADGGRIAVVAPHGVGRNPWRPLAARIADILAGLGFTLRGQIVWDKKCTGNRTTWGSWESSNNPALRDRTEAIIVAHKGRAELVGPQPLPADWLPGELFMALTQDLWTVRAETNDVGHPAPFPVELAERLIRLYGSPGCHVLDPFAGSGTVGVAAARLGCRATLVDVDATYCELAAGRVRREQDQVEGVITQ